MSIVQRELAAERILWRADNQIRNGFDSISVHVEALRELDKLAFNVSDLRFYKQKLSKITGMR
jgi:hypothetical protein